MGNRLPLALGPLHSARLHGTASAMEERRVVSTHWLFGNTCELCHYPAALPAKILFKDLQDRPPRPPEVTRDHRRQLRQRAAR